VLAFFLLFEYEDIELYFVASKLLHFSKFSQNFYEVLRVSLKFDEWIALTIKLIDKYFKDTIKPLSQEMNVK